MIERLLVEFPVSNRRWLFAGLVVLSVLGLISLMMATLASQGLSIAELFMIGFFAITLPWLVIGFWNAILGLLLMRFAKDPVAAVNPMVSALDADLPIKASTAILSCIRNEDTATVSRNLDSMLAGLAQAGMSRREKFTLYVLSDTSEADIALEEERVFEDLKTRWRHDFEVVYRRRSSNPGFKAGNIRDFCQRWGSLHDFMLVLDADSYMSSDAVLKLVRMMQSHPKAGILQSLVVGLPTTSAFARVFQYGMRLGMRSYTIGSAWWQGDCGPYWGHNALIRLEPFIDSCELPHLSGKGPLSGTVLSHDQLEATFMRRAGYDVRVVPEEDGSFEENPTSLPEFIRRDLRWCQGNLQYLKLMTLPGLKLVSRWQLVLAILMFVGSPAWMLFMFTSALVTMFSNDTSITFDRTMGITTLIVVMSMVFAPKIVTVVDILSRKDLRKAFGGPLGILGSTLVEIIFSALLAPIMAVAHTIFIAGLIFGRKIGWSAQQRDASDISIGFAAARLWPQTLFGLLGAAFIGFYASGALLFALPVILGPLLAIPFAMTSASSRFGRWFMASGFWRIPEETATPTSLLSLNLPALPGATEAMAGDVTVVGESEAPTIVPGE
ncbi:MAG: glucans biosynthesis glucosyltransferase MdoH [Stappiaceae bacterium]